MEIPCPRLSWSELSVLSKVRGLTKIYFEWMPGIGYFLTVEGTDKAKKEVRRRLWKLLPQRKGRTKAK